MAVYTNIQLLKDISHRAFSYPTIPRRPHFWWRIIGFFGKTACFFEAGCDAQPSQMYCSSSNNGTARWLAGMSAFLQSWKYMSGLLLGLSKSNKAVFLRPEIFYLLAVLCEEPNFDKLMSSLYQNPRCKESWIFSWYLQNIDRGSREYQEFKLKGLWETPSSLLSTSRLIQPSGPLADRRLAVWAVQCWRPKRSCKQDLNSLSCHPTVRRTGTKKPMRSRLLTLRPK